MPSLEPMVTMASVTGVEFDSVAGLVPVADGFAEAGNAFGEGVAVGLLLAGGLDHLVDDVGGGRSVGVAHAEVDDVLAAATGGGFELSGDVEDVGGEAFDAGGIRRSQ